MQKVGIGACCYPGARCCPVLGHVAFAASIWVAASAQGQNSCSLVTGCVTPGESFGISEPCLSPPQWTTQASLSLGVRMTQRCC